METPEGEVILKASNFTELQEEVEASQRDVSTLSGYVHIMGKEMTALEHKTTMNVAKLMRNTLIIGGL